MNGLEIRTNNWELKVNKHVAGHYVGQLTAHLIECAINSALVECRKVTDDAAEMMDKLDNYSGADIQAVWAKISKSVNAKLKATY